VDPKAVVILDLLTFVCLGPIFNEPSLLSAFYVFLGHLFLGKQPLGDIFLDFGRAKHIHVLGVYYQGQPGSARLLLT
jgi:hypothetical protein